MLHLESVQRREEFRILTQHVKSYKSYNNHSCIWSDVYQIKSFICFYISCINNQTHQLIFPSSSSAAAALLCFPSISSQISPLLAVKCSLDENINSLSFCLSCFSPAVVTESQRESRRSRRNQAGR